jgi:CRISPR-associated endonuclease/helicase Cas3
MFAHSLDGRPVGEWEPLSHHLAAVGARAADFAAAFGWNETARAAGLLHDIGKCSAAFQAYIARPRDDAAGGPRGPDHSTAGARVALKAYGEGIGRLLAFCIAGHHAGLADGTELRRRLDEGGYAVEPYRGWESHSGALPVKSLLRPNRQGVPSKHGGFTQAFLARMLFSCLVDADFLETEAFYAQAKDEPVERGGHTSLPMLRERLCRYMAAKAGEAAASPVNDLRARVLEHAVRKAALAPGLFTLTVPTGGGKTLASLSFALEHAVRHGMDRVIYVIPYTSIIEQTAEVFRTALETKEDVLEHHASFDWERAADSKAGVAGADDEGPAGIEKLRRAAENWDVPVVVTTAVQFFESLFANRPSRCRKLHNLARAVIVLDEAQTLPLHLLRPCMAALDELCANYGVSVVLCTATQPALRDKGEGSFKGGFKIGDERELAPDPFALYAALRRVSVEVLKEPVTDAAIAARFSEQPQMLCIVNSRAHARTLFEAISDMSGAMHLTTLMCPRHRQAVLRDVRDRLKKGEPVRLVATSLIEAGVDVDFPEVWRAEAGLDAIAQAAGRCNREGRRPTPGRVVVFKPADARSPRALEAFWQATRSVLAKHRDDLLGLEAIEAYFSELYWQKGPEALDAVEVDGRRGVLAAIGQRAGALDFPFRSIAEAFRLIDDVMEPVIVPWRADASDDDAGRLLQRIRGMDRPRTTDLRRLQQYTVSIPRQVRGRWLAMGALTRVHAALGDSLLAFEDLAHYRPGTGLDLADFGMRAAETNIIS